MNRGLFVLLCSVKNTCRYCIPLWIKNSQVSLTDMSDRDAQGGSQLIGFSWSTWSIFHQSEKWKMCFCFQEWAKWESMDQTSPEASKSKLGDNICSDFRFILFSFDPQKTFHETPQEYFYELQLVTIFPDCKCHVISLKMVSQTNFSDKLLDAEVSNWGCVRQDTIWSTNYG